jgi:hypothetical protein
MKASIEQRDLFEEMPYICLNRAVAGAVCCQERPSVLV